MNIHVSLWPSCAANNAAKGFSFKPCQTFSAMNKLHLKLEALGECRPPWPKQIITPIFSNVVMLSLFGERLPAPLPPPPPKKKKKKKVLDHYLQNDLGLLPLLWCLFAHLLILEYPDHHQNLMFFIVLPRTPPYNFIPIRS